MNALEIRTTVAVSFLYLVRMLGLFMVIPVLPLATDLASATPLLIGIALGVYGLSQALLQIPLGVLSDRIGRKPVIAGGLVVFIVGSLVAATADDVYGVILGRFLQGCGAMTSALLALVGDLTTIRTRTLAMAVIGMTIGASFGLALVFGPLVFTTFGLDGLFYGTAALGVLGLAVLAVAVPTPRRMKTNLDSAVAVDRLGTILREPQILRVNAGIFVLQFLLMSGFVAFPAALVQIDVPPVDHAMTYFWILLATFVLMGPLMRLADRREWTRPVLLGGSLLFVIGALAILGSRSAWLVYLGLAAYFMAVNLLEVVLPSLLSKVAPAGNRGTAMGTYSTAQFLGAFAGGATGGFVSNLWDVDAVLLVNALIAAGWFLTLTRMPPIPSYSSRTVELPGGSANQIAAALSSVHGVHDVMLLEDEGVAYLKVDDEIFDDRALDALQRAES